MSDIWSDPSSTSKFYECEGSGETARMRTGSPEPSLVAYTLSTIISWAGSNRLHDGTLTRFRNWEALYSFIISWIFPKDKTKLFKLFTVLRKLELTWQFCPLSHLGEYRMHPWLPVREIAHAQSAKNDFECLYLCLLIMRTLIIFRKNTAQQTL